jgi:hypothetical protein
MTAKIKSNSNSDQLAKLESIRAKEKIKCKQREKRNDAVGIE